jgi:hypothetical protein
MKIDRKHSPLAIFKNLYDKYLIELSLNITSHFDIFVSKGIGASDYD